MFNYKLLLIGFFCLYINAGMAKQQVDTVNHIVRAVSSLSPRISVQKATYYAISAVLAAQSVHSPDFYLDPVLLIAIAFQESSLRETLPEGPAGELGICQVRKSWRHNPAFIARFGEVSEASFNSASSSFQYAAWIMKENAKLYKKVGDLPTWTYYNSHSKNARTVYYIKVSLHLLVLTHRGSANEIKCTSNQ